MQSDADFVTKTELRQALRDRGLPISDRNLTYYTSIGLAPAAVRIGGRAGAYPKVVIEQLAWVMRSRDRGQSIDSIKELLPLWRWLMRNRVEGRIDLNELELVARRPGLSAEANFAVPYLVSEVLLCLCVDCLRAIEWVLKDGSPFHHGQETPLTLSFMLGTVNGETGLPELVAWSQLAFPGMGHPDPDDPMSITLGLPVGVRLSPAMNSGQSTRDRCGGPPRRTRIGQEEVLPLT